MPKRRAPRPDAATADPATGGNGSGVASASRRLACATLAGVPTPILPPDEPQRAAPGSATLVGPGHPVPRDPEHEVPPADRSPPDDDA